MDWSAHVRTQLPSLDLDPAREADIVEEIAQQLEATYEDARERGDDDAAARAAAMASIADWSSLARDIVAAERSRIQRAASRVTKPLTREPAGTDSAGRLWREIWQDARHGLRLLGSHRAFAVTAILTLALTIGANTAIFSIVDTILLRPLAFPDANALVTLSESIEVVGMKSVPFSPPDLRDFLEAQRSFSAVAAFRPVQYELNGNGTGTRITAARVSASLFDVVGIAPLVGRTFTAEEDTGGQNLAVLSHALWQTLFAGDASVVGRTLLLERRPFTIVGVMPAAFRFPTLGLRNGGPAADVFVPITFTREEMAARTNNFANLVVARLRTGVTIENARAEAATIAASILEQYPGAMKTRFPTAQLDISVDDLHSEVVGSSRPALLVMLATVTLLVLIGCANVGNLVLALAAGRRRELAVRASLGAGRTRLMRQLLVENLVLAAAGGAAGLLAATWLVATAPLLLPAELPRVDEITINGRVLAFTAFVSIATALVFGLAPGLQGSRVDMRAALNEGTRGTTPSTRRLRASLVIAQCAMAVVLLATAGLLLRSFTQLLATDPGFRADQALSVTTYLPAGGYVDGADVRTVLQTALDRVRTLPGVRHAGLSTDRPLLATERRTVFIEHRAADGGPIPLSVHSWIAGEYLEGLGARLVRGRFLSEADDADAPLAVVVSESFAAQFWPNEDAIGKRMRTRATDRRGENAQWMTVVGIVSDVHDSSLRAAPAPHTYTPIAQLPDATLADNISGMFRAPHFAIATAGEPRTAANMVRQELLAIDPLLTFGYVGPMRDAVADTLAPQRFTAGIVGALALAALCLASVGLHGVLAYGISQRQQEIGVRMALGANRSDVLTLVFKEGLTLVSAGLALGLAIALGVSSLLRTMLFGVTPTDPLTFIGVVAVLLMVGAFAIWLPARQAARVEPATAVRAN